MYGRLLAKSKDLISLSLVKPEIRRYRSTLPPDETCPPYPPPCQLSCPPPPCPPCGPYAPATNKPPWKIPHPPFYNCPRTKYEVNWIYINDIPPKTTMRDFVDRAAQICFWTELMRGKLWPRLRLSFFVLSYLCNIV